MSDTTIFDYLDWRGDLTFARSPFCSVDALILTELSYINYTGIVPAHGEEGSITINQASRQFFQKHAGKEVKIGAIMPAKIIDLLKKAASCSRFGPLPMSCYVDIIDTQGEEQFSALCVHINEKTLFVAFRGTDDTIVGWREDFNMFFKAPVPAQLRAAEYLESVGKFFDGNLIVGGHSKGGNLAVWAATHCSPDVTDRILVVFNFDGPGFAVDFRSTDGYQAVKSRIRTIVPESSVVGMFMEHEDRFSVVKSTRKGIWQHDALSWCVKGNRFEYADGLSPEMMKINGILASWINNMDNTQREKFTESFFGLLEATNASTLTDLVANKKALIKAITSADAETKKALRSAFGLLVGESTKSVTEWIKTPLKRKEKSIE